MSGLAAELRGARDWMKVATAGEEGSKLYTCNKTRLSNVHLEKIVTPEGE